MTCARRRLSPWKERRRLGPQEGWETAHALQFHLNTYESHEESKLSWGCSDKECVPKVERPTIRKGEEPIIGRGGRNCDYAWARDFPLTTQVIENSKSRGGREKKKNKGLRFKECARPRRRRGKSVPLGSTHTPPKKTVKSYQEPREKLKRTLRRGSRL